MIRFLFYILYFLSVVQAHEIQHANVELQIPLTPRMSYDCTSDGHSIRMKEASFEGIPLSDGEVVLDYYLPEGTIWSDLKFRTSMGSLYISIPVSYPHFYTLSNINEQGIIV